jgi:hypothetical protein
MGRHTATKIEKQKECDRFSKSLFRNMITIYRFKSDFFMLPQSNSYRKLPPEPTSLL